MKQRTDWGDKDIELLGGFAEGRGLMSSLAAITELSQGR